MKSSQYDVVIIGGGFGGLHCALTLKNYTGKILLVDKNNYHLFQPLLYQVASAALSSVKIAAPLREVLSEHTNTTVLMGEVSEINRHEHSITVKDHKYFFKKLVVAVGDRPNFFGHDDWAKHAVGLKTLKDAFSIRNKILSSYEAAEMADDEEEIKRELTFVVVGGGPTGVELSGAIAEIAHKTMISDFRRINPRHTKVYLIEASPNILGMYSQKTSESAKKQLESLGVEVKTNSKVINIEEGKITLENETIETSNIFWAAGNTGLSLLKTLGSGLSMRSQVIVTRHLHLPEDPDIYVIGDAAHFEQDGKPLPALAPVAMQQGHYVARRINGQIAAETPFRYLDKGSMATIGKSRAVGEVGPLRMSGLFAWLAWCVIHLYYLILVRNRFSLFMTWVYTYFTSDRGARVISEPRK